MSQKRVKTVTGVGTGVGAAVGHYALHRAMNGAIELNSLT